MRIVRIVTAVLFFLFAAMLVLALLVTPEAPDQDTPTFTLLLVAAVAALIGYIALPRKRPALRSEDESSAAEALMRTLEEAMVDGVIDKDEQAAIDRSIEALGITSERRKKAVLTDILAGYISSAVDDQIVDDDEARKVETVALALGVPFTRKLDKEFQKARRLWILTEAPLPSTDIPVSLQRDEIGVFLSYATLFEYRVSRISRSYSGPAARIKIAKGIYWRAGQYSGRTESTEELKEIDRGDLILTTDRIIFSGRKKNVSTRFSRVAGIVRHRNGLELHRENAKAIFFSCDADHVDAIAVYMARIMDGERPVPATTGN